MAEAVAVAGVGDHLPGGAVDRGPGDPGADGADTGEHGGAHHPVAVDVGRVGPTGDKGAGQVRAVAAQHQAHVDEHQVAGLQLAVRGHGVRPGRIGAEGDDGGEARPLGAHLAHGQLQGKGDLALGHARFDGGVHRLEDLLVQAGRGAQQLEFVRAFDLAHGLDQAALGGKFQAALAGHPGQVLEGRVEQVVAFKGETRQAESVDQPFEQGQQTAGVHFDLEERRLGLGLEGEAGVGEQEGAAFGGDEQEAGALLDAVVGCGVAAQVAAVVRLADEQSVDPPAAQAGLQSGDPVKLRVHFRPRSRPGAGP